MPEVDDVSLSALYRPGLCTIYWDNGVNGQYGFGLFDRSNNSVTQPGLVNAIMSGLAARTKGGGHQRWTVR